MESYRYQLLCVEERQALVNSLTYSLIFCHDPVVLQLDHGYIYAEAGDLCLCHGQQEIHFLPDQPTRVSVLSLSQDYCEQYLQTQFYQLPIFYDFFHLQSHHQDALFFRTGQHVTLQNMLNLLMEEAQPGQQGQGPIIYHLLVALFHQLHQVHQDLLSIAASSMMPHRLAGAFLKYMEQHMADISLEGMAHYFGYHPTYFSKLCKQLLKTSFSEKLRQLRFERALYLLEHSQLRINQIMQEVGYHDLGHFHHYFKQRYALTPLQYRKQKQQDRHVAASKRESVAPKVTED